MADEAKSGNDVMMFVKIGTPAAWVVVACGKSKGWSGSTGMIETTSDCSGNDKTSIAGLRSWTAKFDGQAVKEDATPTKASFKTLAGLWKAGKSFPWKLVGVDDPTDIVRGDVNITALDKNANFNEVVGFSATFEGTGPASFTPEV